MIPTSADDLDGACLAALERALAAGDAPDLGGCPAAVLDHALQAFVKRHGAAAAPVLRAIADASGRKDVRRTARLAMYRLARAGIAVPPPPARFRPVVTIVPGQPVRTWLSGIDGSGSRAVWILFEGGLGSPRQLCSIIVNDEAGILEAAGGAITRRRLDSELRSLREHQKLPWVEGDPARACALVREALALHARTGTSPPAEFDRWRPFFRDSAGEPVPPARRVSPDEPDPLLLDRSADLLEFLELGGWFVDPGAIHEDALALLQARESRLVVSDQIKAEREAAIIDAVIEKQFAAEHRRRWSKRLDEMAFIFRATQREEPARIAECVAAALADESRSPTRIPLVRALALRGLELGAEVALGRVKLAEVSRAPRRGAPA
jgi:hypothetical protein